MELELHYDMVNCFEMELDTTICQEETQEAIVPDACPDILRILDTRAQAYLTGKQVKDGALCINGSAKACVLYLPEGAGQLQRMEVVLPFSAQADAPGLTAQGSLIAAPRVRWAETRMLNPRKVLVRVDLAVDVKAYQSQQLKLCCGAEESENGIQQLKETQNADIVMSVQEKPFTFTDDVDFGPTGSGDAELLCIHGDSFCNESKLIGSKLIFKGTVELDALFCVSGELKSSHTSLPFSQIMEVSGVGEDCVSELRIVLSEISYRAAINGQLTVEVTLELLAQAVVWEHRQAAMLTDLYSTSRKMQTTTQSCLLHQTMEHGMRTVPVRELAETSAMVRSINHSWADLGEVRVSHDSEQSLMTAEVQFNAIYLDDGGELQSVTKNIPVQCRSDSPASSRCLCWCSAPRDVYVTPAAGGLEVRFSLDFHCHMLCDRKIDVIESASLEEERVRNDEKQPSIVLRLAAPGERLWDIAKSYGTTAEEIVAANELEEDELPRGKMLLIPKVR